MKKGMLFALVVLGLVCQTASALDFKGFVKSFAEHKTRTVIGGALLASLILYKMADEVNEESMLGVNKASLKKFAKENKKYVVPVTIAAGLGLLALDNKIERNAFTALPFLSK